MANENVNVNLDEDSKYRVALDLMHTIHSYEAPKLSKANARGYFLELFTDCYTAQFKKTPNIRVKDDRSWDS